MLGRYAPRDDKGHLVKARDDLADAVADVDGRRVDGDEAIADAQRALLSGETVRFDA